MFNLFSPSLDFGREFNSVITRSFCFVIAVQLLLDNFVFSPREYQIVAEMHFFRSFEEGIHQYRNFIYQFFIPCAPRSLADDTNFFLNLRLSVQTVCICP